MDRLEFDGRVRCGWRQNHLNTLRTLHHVSVGDDVAVGIDDDSCTNGMLPDDSRCVGVTVVFRGSVPGYYDLDHRG